MGIEIKITDEKIWTRACELEGLTPWEPGRVAEGYRYETRKRGYTDGGLEKAVAEWLDRDESAYPDEVFEIRWS